MLVMDSEYRINPDEALRHPFISMSHFVDANINNSTLVKSSLQKMEVCKRKVCQLKVISDESLFIYEISARGPDFFIFSIISMI